MQLGYVRPTVCQPANTATAAQATEVAGWAGPERSGFLPCYRASLRVSGSGLGLARPGLTSPCLKLQPPQAAGTAPGAVV